MQPYLEISQEHPSWWHRALRIFLFGGSVVIAAFLVTTKLHVAVDYLNSFQLVKLKHFKITKSQPNVVFILADDMGWNSIGYDELDLSFATPTLTKLGRNGIIMGNYYAQEECTPSRAALLTGRYPLTIGMQYGNINNDTPWGMHLNETTLAEILRDAGYVTHGLGKWHLGHHSPRYLPTARGFSTYTGFLQGYNYYWSKRNPDLSNFYDFLYMNEDCYYTYGKADMHNYSTHLYRDMAVQIIESHDQSSPLFLYVPFQAVHNPFEDMTGNELIPSTFMKDYMYDEIRKTVKGEKRQQYAMALTIMDAAVSDIVDALESTGMIANTYLIFASDNGGCYLAGGKNGPLRGTKGSLFEGGTKVDAFVYSPLLGTDSVRKSYTNLMHVSDWFPTILAMAGVFFTPASGFELDGVSHFDAWGTDEVVREYMLYNSYYNVEGLAVDKWTNQSFAVRNSQYKLIHAYNSSTYGAWYDGEDVQEDDGDFCANCQCGQTSAMEGGPYFYGLYDLLEDPYETNNLYDIDNDNIASVKAELYAQLAVYEEKSTMCVGIRKRNSNKAAQVWKAAGNYMVPFVEGDHVDMDKNYPSFCGHGVAGVSSVTSA